MQDRIKIRPICTAVMLDDLGLLIVPEDKLALNTYRHLLKRYKLWRVSQKAYNQLVSESRQIHSEELFAWVEL